MIKTLLMKKVIRWRHISTWWIDIEYRNFKALFPKNILLQSPISQQIFHSLQAPSIVTKYILSQNILMTLPQYIIPPDVEFMYEVNEENVNWPRKT